MYKDDYSFHCGLPELHFDQALLWYCKEGTGIERMRRCEGVQLPSWSWASLSSRIIDRDYDLGCSSFCSSLVPWVICTSKYGKPHFHILETNGEPATWRRWRKFWDNHTRKDFLLLGKVIYSTMADLPMRFGCSCRQEPGHNTHRQRRRISRKKHRSLTSCSSDGRKALLIALRLAGSPSNSGPRPSGISRPYCWSSRNLDVTRP